MEQRTEELDEIRNGYSEPLWSECWSVLNVQKTTTWHRTMRHFKLHFQSKSWIFGPWLRTGKRCELFSSLGHRRGLVLDGSGYFAVWPQVHGLSILHQSSLVWNCQLRIRWHLRQCFFISCSSKELPRVLYDLHAALRQAVFIFI